MKLALLRGESKQQQLQTDFESFRKKFPESRIRALDDLDELNPDVQRDRMLARLAAWAETPPK